MGIQIFDNPDEFVKIRGCFVNPFRHSVRNCCVLDSSQTLDCAGLALVRRVLSLILVSTRAFMWLRLIKPPGGRTFRPACRAKCPGFATGTPFLYRSF